MLKSLVKFAFPLRNSRGDFAWDWRTLTLLLAISLGGWSSVSLTSVARATEESSESGEEEESAAAEEVELWAGRAPAGKPRREAGSKLLLRTRPNTSTGDAASGTTRGVVYREGHYLPCGVNAPIRC